MKHNEDIQILESMVQGALRLEESADPLLRGQIVHLRGTIEALLTIKRTTPELQSPPGTPPGESG